MGTPSVGAGACAVAARPAVPGRRDVAQAQHGLCVVWQARSEAVSEYAGDPMALRTAGVERS